MDERNKEVEAIIQKQQASIDRVFNSILNSVDKDERILETLRSSDWYYNDEDIKPNNNTLRLEEGIWCDRKETGDPPPYLWNENLLIIVRYFEVSDKSSIDRESVLAIDYGWFNGYFWTINNDWDEVSLGTEILAYRLSPTDIPDRYLREKRCEIMYDGKVDFANT